MAVKNPKACSNCSKITDDDKCSRCGNKTSKDWQGYVVIVDARKSEIAKRMGIDVDGEYALRVR